MTFTGQPLHCPTCGTRIGTLAARTRSTAGPAADVVARWLTEDSWTDAHTTTALHSRYTAWAEEAGEPAKVSLKALAQGMAAQGLRSEHRRDGNYWIR